MFGSRSSAQNLSMALRKTGSLDTDSNSVIEKRNLTPSDFLRLGGRNW